MIIKKIVISGGPCGGKTSAMEYIKETFSTLGYRVLFIHESASELISGGIAPWTCGTSDQYQLCQLRYQLEKEKIIKLAAQTMEVDKILIVCDRGTLDNKAYMSEEAFKQALAIMQVSEDELLAEYDGVFHLVSAAIGASEYYTTSNNEARSETCEEAAILDEYLGKAWSKHPQYYLIDNSTDFKQKMQRLLKAIAICINEDISI